MDDRRTVNRSMFWRVLRRSVFANRGRLLVILLALGAGSAVTAALLNLQVDAKRRITSDFRSFGANVIVSPREGGEWRMASIPDEIPSSNGGQEVTKIAFLYVAIKVRTEKEQTLPGSGKGFSEAVLVGLEGHNVQRVLRSEFVETSGQTVSDVASCRLGQKVAKELKAHARDYLELQSDAVESKLPNPQVVILIPPAKRKSPDEIRIQRKVARNCYVSTVESFGGPEDSQIFTDLYTAQELAGPPPRISAVQLNVPGMPAEIQNYVANLQQKLPGIEVRPIRQFTEGEARLYDKISGVLTATVAVVLLLTALCVMAAMTNVAMERKNDVGLMKAIGGSVRRVLRIFLAEAALLGLAGGLIGAAVGILLSMALGKAVFGVAAQPRLVVYPVSVALTVIVAILAAYPLRRLALVRPASVFRGEE